MRRLSARAFLRDRSASSAVEFAIICFPFFMMLLLIMQMGIFYFTQASLDDGVVQEADAMVRMFNNCSQQNGVVAATCAAAPIGCSTVKGSSTGAVTPSATQLVADIATCSGGMIRNTTVVADLTPFSAMSSAPVAFGGTGAPSIGKPGSVIALRAQAPVTAFFPGFGSLNVRSTALIRRQSS